MNISSFPVQRYLVPEKKPTAPDGFVQLDTSIMTGLPFAIPLTSDLQATVVLPTGLAVSWRDANPADIGSSSEAELSPPLNANSTTGDEALRTPFRLVVQQTRRIIGVIPLVAGLCRLVPDSGSDNLGTQLEILILNWDIRAGSIRGPGNFGSRLSLAWRKANQGANQFSPPFLNPVLGSRLSDTEQ